MPHGPCSEPRFEVIMTAEMKLSQMLFQILAYAIPKIVFFPISTDSALFSVWANLFNVVGWQALSKRRKASVLSLATSSSIFLKRKLASHSMLHLKRSKGL